MTYLLLLLFFTSDVIFKSEYFFILMGCLRTHACLEESHIVSDHFDTKITEKR